MNLNFSSAVSIELETVRQIWLVKLIGLIYIVIT